MHHGAIARPYLSTSNPGVLLKLPGQDHVGIRDGASGRHFIIFRHFKSDIWLADIPSLGESDGLRRVAWISLWCAVVRTINRASDIALRQRRNAVKGVSACISPQ